MARPRIVVLAQDLIWQTRLAAALEAAGAEPVRAKTMPELDRGLVCASGVVVDLTASAYDPIAAIGRAVDAGRRVVAVGQHDDRALRKRAITAGADRVYAYRKLHEAGRETLGAWLAAFAGVAGEERGAGAAGETGVPSGSPAGAERSRAAAATETGAPSGAPAGGDRPA
ncbi:MAG TPA: hypothetical protein VNJ28_08880, partial [Candidatus Limnocylindrales bacterium]|nr:hypothetical protein [Candidatus Limnocylindrales bacterium]